jgi:hypothetical protein
MKRQIASVLGVLGLLLVAACANAQSLNVTANVPFDFVVDKATLPAGAYSIQSISSSASTLAIRSKDRKTQMVVLPNNAQHLNPSSKSCLVFHRYGEQYFLSQIWVAGDSSGAELRMTRREAEIASNTQRSDDVIILAALR